jgi:hypothetical protein
MAATVVGAVMEASATTCARAFKVRVIAGQEEAYARYLREVVEPIDALAHEAGVFAHMLAMRPESPGADWTHARVFFFADTAQRERFTAAMAACAGRFDGSAEATVKRKAFADTLRVALGSSDYAVGPS